MKKIYLILFVLLSANAWAQSKFDHVEPMFWWVGMKNPKLQLLIHGKNIAGYSAKLNYPGVKLLEQHQVENPNYLFLDLEIFPFRRRAVKNSIIAMS
jgi:hypothetical protein